MVTRSLTNLLKQSRIKNNTPVMENKVEIIQINISGEDKPGLTSSLTSILAQYDAFILDIGQANIHSSLTMGILIKTTSDKSGFIMNPDLSDVVLIKIPIVSDEWIFA